MTALACGRTGLFGADLADDGGGADSSSSGGSAHGGGGGAGGSATGGKATGGNATGGNATGGGATGGSGGRDPCAGIDCGEAPPAACADERTIRRYVEPGVCSDGRCSYEAIDGPCPEPPAPECSTDGMLLTTSFGPGRCVGNATCNYGASTTLCEFGCQVGRCLDAEDVVQISGGGKHTCARLADRSARCWGDNSLGQLGIGTTSTSSPPGVVANAVDLVELRAGRNHTCAVQGNGAAACWGFNSRGQLGDGTKETRTSPVEVAGLVGVKTVAPGMQHTCALRWSGSVDCWGSNYEGMLGDGTIDDSLTPVVVVDLSDVTALAATGELALSGHSCATTAGAVRCWGMNYHGELGNGMTEASNVPVTVLGLGDVRTVALGGFQSVAIDDSGVVRWGSAWALGPNTSFATPTPLTGLEDATALTAGGSHACALRASGTVWCWGTNEYGALGDGTYSDRAAPVEVAGLADVVEISAGYDHTCARVASGPVYCWGDNTSDQLGSSGFDSSPTPVLVPGVGRGSTR